MKKYLTRLFGKLHDSQRIGLRPLTPEYRLNQHEVYAKALEEALADTRVKNIALSGSCGVGKSSILQRLKKKPYQDQTIFISLSTLRGFPASSKISKPDSQLIPLNLSKKK